METNKILEVLKYIKKEGPTINKLVLIFNYYDINYEYMTDLDMYIHYFENIEKFQDPNI